MRTNGQGSVADLTRSVKEEALRLGFAAAGVAGVSSLGSRSHELTQWIGLGFCAELYYMEHFFDRQAQFLADFSNLKSILVVAVPYAQALSPHPDKTPAGRIAKYAQGRDYHRVVQKRLKQLEASIQNLVKAPIEFRHCVDTSPIQERVLAESAGLGFFGKNTCLIRPRGGSFVFLAALLTDLELIPDEPLRWDCGSCTLCLEACPTHALKNPYELDARLCISYLTIEFKGTIHPELRPLMGDWLFGCDVCQDVCPYNKKENSTSWPEFTAQARGDTPLDLETVLSCRTDEQFIQQFAATPLIRAKRQGLLRNASIVAGNLANPLLVPALRETLSHDPSPVVRQHAAWALGKIGTKEALEALHRQLETESDSAVLTEISSVLTKR